MKSGYIELAGVLKWIAWEDTSNGPIDLSGNATGWGFNISSTQVKEEQAKVSGVSLIKK
jgi:hypothetical protein